MKIVVGMFFELVKKIRCMFNFLTRPFVERSCLIILILLCFNGSYCLHKLIAGKLGPALAVFSTGFLVAYTIVLLLSFSRILRRVLAPVILLFFLAHTIIDETCLYVMQVHLNPDIIGTILATNLDETKEFILSYMDSFMLLLIISCLFISCGCYYLAEYCFDSPVYRFKTYKMFFFVPILILSIAECLRPNIFLFYVLPECEFFVYFEGTGIESLQSFFSEFADLKQHQEHPELEKIRDAEPNKVVLIIGESYAKTHSGLYGYNKQTTPNMFKLQKDSLLVVFGNVESTEIQTLPAFRTILNTHNHELKGDSKWYESYSLIRFLQDVGYVVEWISTQQGSSIWEGAQNKYAALCDSSIFIKSMYDEEILPFLKPSGEKKALFFHINGQHSEYSLRYPSNYQIFKAEDYAQQSIKQRSILASYDNATLYNDFVVSKIMTAFENEDAIVFYFPDHGEDVFEVSDDYVGHGRYGVSESFSTAKKIPFVIYLSPTYKQRHPNETNRIFQASDNIFVTDNVAYSVIDILGYRFHDNENVRKFSLFR